MERLFSDAKSSGSEACVRAGGGVRRLAFAGMACVEWRRSMTKGAHSPVAARLARMAFADHVKSTRN